MNQEQTTNPMTKPEPVDADLSQRPGVPMEAEPRPVGAAHWKAPDKQPDPGYILKREGLDELTPVFGTSIPPRGLSGVMRRAAYRIPEHHTSHWLMLLLADRIDAIEHGSLRKYAIALPIAIGGVALVGAVCGGKKKRRWR